MSFTEPQPRVTAQLDFGARDHQNALLDFGAAKDDPSMTRTVRQDFGARRALWLTINVVFPQTHALLDSGAEEENMLLIKTPLKMTALLDFGAENVSSALNKLKIHDIQRRELVLYPKNLKLDHQVIATTGIALLDSGARNKL